MRYVNNTFIMIAAAALVACASAPATPPKIDRISAEELERIMPKPVPNLSLEDIVKLTKQGISADDIIEKIKSSQSTYALTPSKSLDLSKQGVDNKVLDFIYMQREQVLRDSVANEINKREEVNKKKQEQLMRRQQLRYTPFYDPFYDPYWGWRYNPYFRNRFYLRPGF